MAPSQETHRIGDRQRSGRRPRQLDGRSGIHQPRPLLCWWV
jgi:hypothetical protein